METEHYTNMFYKKCFTNCVIGITFSFTVKAATLIFIPGRGSAVSSAKERRGIRFCL